MLFEASEISFLHLIVNDESLETRVPLIYHITSEQYDILSKVASYILDETIPLNSSQFKRLKSSKNIIRGIYNARLSNVQLSSRINLLKVLAQLAIQEYEICSESSIGSSRRMEPNKRQKRETCNNVRSSNERSESETDTTSTRDSDETSDEEEETSENSVNDEQYEINSDFSEEERS